MPICVANTVDLLTNASIVTASIAREVPSAASPKETAMFRLVASCNAITHKGQVLLAWAPGANGEALSLTTDGTPEPANRFSARPTPGLPSTFPRKRLL